MSSLRVAGVSALVACVVVLTAAAWLDARAPVTIMVAAVDQEPLRVSIAGAVATPGVVTVASGARLADVTEAAGGLRDDADTSGLNLAGRVGDGEHIVIPSRSQSGDAPVVRGAVAVDAALDLNVATAAELEALPGIGEVLAARIVAYREAYGPFASIDELTAVEGISPRLVEELRPHVTVGGGG